MNYDQMNDAVSRAKEFKDYHDFGPAKTYYRYDGV